MAMTARLSENSQQGFEGIKADLCLASTRVSSNIASEIALCLRPNGIRSRGVGKERDTETGLDYFEAQHLSSVQGRFTSPDPARFSIRHIENPQKWNMYSYVINNPLARFDPDGRDDPHIVVKAVWDKLLCCQKHRVKYLIIQRWKLASISFIKSIDSS
jgi:RHS repeat-associated protein